MTPNGWHLVAQVRVVALDAAHLAAQLGEPRAARLAGAGVLVPAVGVVLLALVMA